MTETPRAVSANRDLIRLVVLLAAGLTAFHLWMAATGRSVNRAQHLGTAVEYARGHIDLMSPIVQGTNANDVPTPLDFPIWQGIVAVFMKLFGLWYGWGNVVALFFLLTSLWPVFDLTRRLFSERVAWWAMLFYLLQPLNFIVGGSASGDGAAWAFATWFIYLAYRMMGSGGWGWWAAAVVAGALSAVTKAPFFTVAGLTTFFWLVTEYRKSTRAWLQLATAGFISGAFFWAWNIHGHHCFEKAEFPLVNLDVMAGADVKNWYFGTLGFRLSPGNWIRFTLHVTTSVLGNFAFVALLLASLRLKGTRWMWLWLVAAVCSTLVFTPLIFGHEHYLFIFSPAVAVLCACAAEAFEPSLWTNLRAGPLTKFAVLAGFAVFSLAEGLQLDHLNLCFDRYFAEVGQTIREHTAPGERIVVWGASWGEPFLHAERDGLTGGFGFNGTAMLEDPRKLARLKELGYTKVVLMNPPPLVVAMTEVSGTHSERMVDLPKQLPAGAQNWAVVYKSPAVLIVDIPK